jgi:Zn-dependent M28 family amino/carboxypeptidase
VRVQPLEVRGRFHFDRSIDSIAWAPNVLGVVSGSDPRLRHEYILITAHFDGLGRATNAPPGSASVLNGADDNASGVAAMLEMARVLSGGQRPKRSVIFAAVSGEEAGLWGSDYLATRSPVPVSQIVANINLDMVGRASGDTVYITGADDPRIRKPTTDAIRAGRRGLILLDRASLDARWPTERFDDRSDHVNFRRRGIPTLSFFTGTHPDYHTPKDDEAKLNYDALSRITALAADILRAIGNR